VQESSSTKLSHNPESKKSLNLNGMGEDLTQVVLSLWYNMKPDTLSTAKAYPNVSATLQSTSSQPIYLRSTLTSLSFIHPHLPSGCQKISPPKFFTN